MLSYPVRNHGGNSFLIVNNMPTWLYMGMTKEHDDKICNIWLSDNCLYFSYGLQHTLCFTFDYIFFPKYMSTSFIIY